MPLGWVRRKIIPIGEYSLQAKGRMGMYHENADLTAPKTKVKS